MGSVDISNVKKIPKPDWFKEEVGFCFLDDDNDLCVYLGCGGWRDTETLGDLQIYGKEGYALFTLNFMPADELVAYRYKNEWFIGKISDHLDDCKPLKENSNGA
jgi:hypothetical protein